MATDLSPFTAVEQVLIAHACEDHAGSWYTNVMVGGSLESACRYTAEGNLGRLCDKYDLGTVWRAVRAYLTGHPEILSAGRPSNEQKAANKAARDVAAQALLDESENAFAERRYDETLALIDRAELASPGYTRFDQYREVVRDVAAGRLTP